MAFAGGSLLVLVCRTGIAAKGSALLNALLREGVLSQGQVDRVRADLDNQAALVNFGSIPALPRHRHRHTRQLEQPRRLPNFPARRVIHSLAGGYYL